MMGRQSRQMSMIFIDIESLIPKNHLLRKVDRMVSFDFIYDLLAPYYPATGRPSVDPVSMFKMLLVGYLYGIKSERWLVEEVRLNIAYRWFCGFELDDTIPDHSTFSKTRTRKWQQSGLFQNAIYEIVKQCIACGLIDGKAMVADGSYIPANVSRESWIDAETEVEQSMQSYLDALDEELSQQPGFKKPPARTIKKRRITSRTDPDSGYINHGNKRGIGYLMEATVDCKHGILTGVDVYPANEKESILVLRHLERQIKLGVPMNRLALDRGYDTGAVHRGLELLGVTGYIPAIQFPNAPEKYGFSYDTQRDAFICPEGVGLTYHRLNCNQSTGKYLRCYQIEDDACKHCVKRPSCFDKAGIRRRVLASSCYPAFYRGHQRVGTPEFLSMMRLRKIWAEGSFSVLKREHCISKIRKRGILAATEECLLAAMALNLKRMASAVFFYLHISYSAGTTAGFGSFLHLSTGPTLDTTPKQSIIMAEFRLEVDKMFLEKMNYLDVEKYLKTRDTVVIPVGSIENHGKHMPLGTDTMIPHRIAELYSAMSDTVIAPTVNYGATADIVGFPGTISLGVEGLRALLERICDQLYDYGFRHFIILNGHGGNSKSITEVGHHLYAKGAILANLNWWLIAGELRPEWKGGHGGGEETAAVMGIDPALIHTEYLEEGEGIRNDVSNELPSASWMDVNFKGGSVTIPRPIRSITDNGWLTHGMSIDPPTKATQAWGVEMLNTMAEYMRDFTVAFDKVALPKIK